MRCAGSRISRRCCRESPCARDLPLPEVSEPEVVRHFNHLSTLNYNVDKGFYPLGSCTMKYNPKVNDQAVLMPGFARIHPYQAEETVQGAIELLYRMQNDMAGILGMDAVSLHPAAGAHGELLGLMLIRAYHEHNGQGARQVHPRAVGGARDEPGVGGAVRLPDRRDRHRRAWSGRYGAS